jgi:hypothetical protein
MSKVFISHAANDKPLVDAFFDLLQTGLGLSDREAFCSSLEGMGIPSGVNFADYIKGQIKNPEVVLIVLSPQYYDSLFCLCELGASWALSTAMIPILVPPMDHQDLKAVLQGVQVRKIDRESDLAEVRDELVKMLGLAPPTARWDAKCKQFQKKLPTLLAEQKPPTKIDYKKHIELQAKYDGSVAELEKALDEAGELKQQIADLKACKDKEQVAEVVAKYSDDWERFEGLCEAARRALRELPWIARKILYQTLNNFDPGPFDDHEWDQIQEAAQDHYLFVDDRRIKINHDDPTISNAEDALDLVRRFLQGDSEEPEYGEDFEGEYIRQYRHEPVFSSQRLWERHLGLRKGRL